jgi:hypothetical protein
LQIHETGKLFKLDLSHLSAEKVVLGDGDQIASLLELVIAIPKRRPRDLGLPTRIAGQIGGEKVSNLEKRQRIRGSEGQREGEGVAAGRETRKGRRESHDLEKTEGGNICDRNGRRIRSREQHVVSREPVTRGSEHSCSESDSSVSEERFAGKADFRSERNVSNVAWRRGTAGRLGTQIAERPVRNTGLERSKARAHSTSTDSDSSEDAAATPTSRDTDIDTESAKSYLSSSDPPIRPTHSSRFPAGVSRHRTGVAFASSRGPHPLEFHTARKHGDPSRSSDTSTPPADDVIHGRPNNVSRVLSLVEHVAAQEQRKWDEKQRRFEREFAAMSRRTYAPRWPFRPLPDLQDVRRVPNQDWQLAWRRKEDERLRKRRKRLVQLRPQGGRQGAAGLARCRKAYRSFLPNGQVGFFSDALLRCGYFIFKNYENTEDREGGSEARLARRGCYMLQRESHEREREIWQLCIAVQRGARLVATHQLSFGLLSTPGNGSEPVSLNERA